MTPPPPARRSDYRYCVLQYSNRTLIRKTRRRPPEEAHWNRICGSTLHSMTHLRISDAASLLGVSDDTVRRWVDRGTLTAHADHAGRKIGRASCRGGGW